MSSQGGCHHTCWFWSWLSCASNLLITERRTLYINPEAAFEHVFPKVIAVERVNCWVCQGATELKDVCNDQNDDKTFAIGIFKGLVWTERLKHNRRPKWNYKHNYHKDQHSGRFCFGLCCSPVNQTILATTPQTCKYCRVSYDQGYKRNHKYHNSRNGDRETTHQTRGNVTGGRVTNSIDVFGFW